jgi:hypothetical protein
VPHSANPKPSWYGESVGHYEGDTLVVDTIGQNTKTFLDVYRTPHSEKLHVVERWRTIDGGNGLELKITVDDPDAFYQPWSAIVRDQRGEEPFITRRSAPRATRISAFSISIRRSQRRRISEPWV